MIYELKKTQFTKISHLLKGDLINLEIKSVVQGFNPGRVYVDNVENPRTAMVWSKGIKGFYFIGDENNLDFNNSINEYIDREISPKAKEQGLNSFEFSGTSKKWDKALENIFKNRNIDMSKQFVYKHKGIDKLSENNFKLDDEYVLEEINQDTFNCNLSNLDYVESTILEWWESIEDFFENGVGFCIIHNQAAVCTCVTSFRGVDSMESHIQTLENYRKRGLATIAVSEFLKYCIDNNYEPYWDCMEKNYGSRALAEKFGYDKAFEYVLYEFEL